MTEQHPITPPPELVQQWWEDPCSFADSIKQAARWGADQQLLACGKYLEQCAAWEEEDVTEMYNYLRPKPPSLKQQALEALQRAEEGWRPIPDDCDTIRRALEALPDE